MAISKFQPSNPGMFVQAGSMMMFVQAGFLPQWSAAERQCVGRRFLAHSGDAADFLQSCALAVTV